MKKITFLSLVALLIAACGHKDANLSGYDCTSQTSLTYTADIQPIMATHCTSCHGSTNPSDNLDLTTYANVKEHVSHDHFLGSLEHESSYEAMPRGAAKLPDSLILKIACWAKNGSPQ